MVSIRLQEMMLGIRGGALRGTRSLSQYKTKKKSQKSIAGYVPQNAHLPLGVVIHASPVMRTCTAVVTEPPASDDGGNTRTAVSTFCGAKVSSGDEAESSGPSVFEGGSDEVAEKDIGLSMMAMHLAMDEYGQTILDDVGDGIALAIGMR